MTQRTCQQCAKPLTGKQRTMCSDRCHKARWRASVAGQVSREREKVMRTCVVCDAYWVTSRRDAKFCSDACKGAHYRASRATRCIIPPDHPVRLLTKQIKRTYEAECAECDARFESLSSASAYCSGRCRNRVKDRRRRARENNTHCRWVWSDFMRVAAKFGFTCAYCGAKPDGQLDPDHVVPLSKGGDDAVANLLPSCRACNSDKRDLLLCHWNADRKRRGHAPRTVAWDASDSRVAHLTSLVVAA